MKCLFCEGPCIKKGFYKRIQKYRCAICNRYQRKQYQYKAYQTNPHPSIKQLSNEGMGISSISRITGIPKTSVQRRISALSHSINKPRLKEKGQVYEVDELYTFIGKKTNPCYLIYAINRRTRQVVDFVCGARNKDNVNKVLATLLELAPRRVYTDGLNLYQYLLPRAIHATFPYKTNRIERKNLTLRTHLKRLSRKTISFSKSVDMLMACFRLYAWGK